VTKRDADGKAEFGMAAAVPLLEVPPDPAGARTRSPRPT
jgi:hypothetical protein